MQHLLFNTNYISFLPKLNAYGQVSSIQRMNRTDIMQSKID